MSFNTNGREPDICEKILITYKSIHMESINKAPQSAPQISAFEEPFLFTVNNPAKKADEYTANNESGKIKLWGFAMKIHIAEKANKIKKKTPIPKITPNKEDVMRRLLFMPSLLTEKRFAFAFFIRTSHSEIFITIYFIKHVDMRKNKSSRACVHIKLTK